MRQQAITVELPEEVYERVKRTARGMRRPVEQALVRIVKAAMPSLDKVPPEYRPELEALEPLSDEELWRVAESQVPTAQKRQLTRLLRRFVSMLSRCRRKSSTSGTKGEQHAARRNDSGC
jgi:hypothetical protein